MNEVSLQIGAGECVGLVGESGSGKTMLSLALMGLLPSGARVKGHAQLKTAGSKDLTHLTEAQWRAVRGREIAMIFQEPMTSLNPVMRVGAQIAEAIRAHEPELRKEEARQRALNALRHRRQISQREGEIKRGIVEAERRNDVAALLRLKQEKLELDRKLAGF